MNNGHKCITCKNYCASVMLPMCYAKKLSIIRSSDNACSMYDAVFANDKNKDKDNE